MRESCKNPKLNPVLRAAAFFTLFTFLSSSISAQTPLPVVPEIPAALISAEGIKIPESLGSVEVQHAGDAGKPWVIYIQDAHAILDAQKHIQQLIAYLQEHYGIDLVAVEGAQGKLDATLLKTFPDKFVKEKTMKAYWQKAELSGGEMAAVFSAKETGFYGIENWKEYKENYHAYLKAQENQPRISVMLAGWRDRLDQERGRVYSPELNEFHEKVSAFREEKINLAEFWKYLVRDAGPGAFAKYPHLSKLSDVFSAEEAGAKGQTADAALRSLAENFKKKLVPKLSQMQLMEFNRAYQAYVSSQSDAAVFLRKIMEIGREAGFSPRLTPEMKKILGTAETLSHIKGTRLFEELELYLAERQGMLAKSPEQKALTARYDEWQLFRSFSRLELSREQWEKIKQNLFSRTPPFRVFQKFYQTAEKRDRIFHENLEKIMDRQKSKRAAVLTGGFHARGFEDALQKSGHSYAVILPKMESLEGEDLYQGAMQGKFSFQREKGTSLYDAFTRDAVMSLVGGLNEPDFRKDLKLWRDEVIRQLAREGRLGEASRYTGYLDELFKVYYDKFGARSPKSKVEIIAALESELRGIHKENSERMWAQFQTRFDNLSAGLRALAGEKSLNSKSFSALWEKVMSPRSSGVAIAIKLDPTAPTGDLFSVPEETAGLPAGTGYREILEQLAKGIPEPAVVPAAAKELAANVLAAESAAGRDGLKDTTSADALQSMVESSANSSFAAQVLAAVRNPAIPVIPTRKAAGLPSATRERSAAPSSFGGSRAENRGSEAREVTVKAGGAAIHITVQGGKITITANGEEKSKTLTAGQLITVGRYADADDHIQVTDESSYLSRLQFYLQYDGKDWFIKHGGGLNATLINGVAVSNQFEILPTAAVDFQAKQNESLVLDLASRLIAEAEDKGISLGQLAGVMGAIVNPSEYDIRGAVGGNLNKNVIDEVNRILNRNPEFRDYLPTILLHLKGITRGMAAERKGKQRLELISQFEGVRRQYLDEEGGLPSDISNENLAGLGLILQQLKNEGLMEAAPLLNEVERMKQDRSEAEQEERFAKYQPEILEVLRWQRQNGKDNLEMRRLISELTYRHLERQARAEEIASPEFLFNPENREILQRMERELAWLKFEDPENPERARELRFTLAQYYESLTDKRSGNRAETRFEEDVQGAAEDLLHNYGLPFMGEDFIYFPMHLVNPYYKLSTAGRKNDAEIRQIFSGALTAFWKELIDNQGPGFAEEDFDRYAPAILRIAADSHLEYAVDSDGSLPASMPAEEAAGLKAKLLAYAPYVDDYDFRALSAWIEKISGVNRDFATNEMMLPHTIADIAFDAPAEELEEREGWAKKLGSRRAIAASLDVFKMIWGKGLDGEGEDRTSEEVEQIIDYINRAEAAAVGPRAENRDNLELIKKEALAFFNSREAGLLQSHPDFAEDLQAMKTVLEGIQDREQMWAARLQILKISSGDKWRYINNEDPILKLTYDLRNILVEIITLDHNDEILGEVIPQLRAVVRYLAPKIPGKRYQLNRPRQDSPFQIVISYNYSDDYDAQIYVTANSGTKSYTIEDRIESSTFRFGQSSPRIQKIAENLTETAEIKAALDLAVWAFEENKRSRELSVRSESDNNARQPRITLNLQGAAAAAPARPFAVRIQRYETQETPQISMPQLESQMRQEADFVLEPEGLRVLSEDSEFEASERARVIQQKEDLRREYEALQQLVGTQFKLALHSDFWASQGEAVGAVPFNLPGDTLAFLDSEGYVHLSLGLLTVGPDRKLFRIIAAQLILAALAENQGDLPETLHDHMLTQMRSGDLAFENSQKVFETLSSFGNPLNFFEYETEWGLWVKSDRREIFENSETALWEIKEHRRADLLEEFLEDAGKTLLTEIPGVAFHDEEVLKAFFSEKLVTILLQNQVLGRILKDKKEISLEEILKARRQLIALKALLRQNFETPDESPLIDLKDPLPIDDVVSQKEALEHLIEKNDVVVVHEDFLLRDEDGTPQLWKTLKEALPRDALFVAPLYNFEGRTLVDNEIVNYVRPARLHRDTDFTDFSNDINEYIQNPQALGSIAAKYKREDDVDVLSENDLEENMRGLREKNIRYFPAFESAMDPEAYAQELKKAFDRLRPSKVIILQPLASSRFPWHEDRKFLKPARNVKDGLLQAVENHFENQRVGSAIRVAVEEVNTPMIPENFALLAPIPQSLLPQAISKYPGETYVFGNYGTQKDRQAILISRRPDDDNGDDEHGIEEDPSPSGMGLELETAGTERAEARSVIASLVAAAAMTLTPTQLGQELPNQPAPAVAAIKSEKKAEIPIPFFALPADQRKVIEDIVNELYETAVQKNDAALAALLSNPEWKMRFVLSPGENSGHQGSGFAAFDGSLRIGINSGTFYWGLSGEPIGRETLKGTILHEFIHIKHYADGSYKKRNKWEEENATRRETAALAEKKVHTHVNKEGVEIVYGVSIAIGKDGLPEFVPDPDHPEVIILRSFVNDYKDIPQEVIDKATIEAIHDLLEEYKERKLDEEEKYKNVQQQLLHEIKRLESRRSESRIEADKSYWNSQFSGKKPWEMTREEFDREIVFHGTRLEQSDSIINGSRWIILGRTDDNLTEGSDFTESYAEASKYAQNIIAGLGELGLVFLGTREAFQLGPKGSYTDSSNSMISEGLFVKDAAGKPVSTKARTGAALGAIPASLADPYAYIVQQAAASGKNVPDEIAAAFRAENRSQDLEFFIQAAGGLENASRILSALESSAIVGHQDVLAQAPVFGSWPEIDPKIEAAITDAGIPVSLMMISAVRAVLRIQQLHAESGYFRYRPGLKADAVNDANRAIAEAVISRFELFGITVIGKTVPEEAETERQLAYLIAEEISAASPGKIILQEEVNAVRAILQWNSGQISGTPYQIELSDLGGALKNEIAEWTRQSTARFKNYMIAQGVGGFARYFESKHGEFMVRTLSAADASRAAPIRQGESKILQRRITTGFDPVYDSGHVLASGLKEMRIFTDSDVNGDNYHDYLHEMVETMQIERLIATNRTTPRYSMHSVQALAEIGYSDILTEFLLLIHAGPYDRNVLSTESQITLSTAAHGVVMMIKRLYDNPAQLEKIYDLLGRGSYFEKEFRIYWEHFTRILTRPVGMGIQQNTFEVNESFLTGGAGKSMLANRLFFEEMMKAVKADSRLDETALFKSPAPGTGNGDVIKRFPELSAVQLLRGDPAEVLEEKPAVDLFDQSIRQLLARKKIVLGFANRERKISALVHQLRRAKGSKVSEAEVLSAFQRAGTVFDRKRDKKLIQELTQTINSLISRSESREYDALDPQQSLLRMTRAAIQVFNRKVDPGRRIDASIGDTALLAIVRNPNQSLQKELQRVHSSLPGDDEDKGKLGIFINGIESRLQNLALATSPAEDGTRLGTLNPGDRIKLNGVVTLRLIVWNDTGYALVDERNNQIHPLQNVRTTIGRGKNQMIQIADIGVSRVQAAVTVDGNSVTVFDMNSQAGTLIIPRSEARPEVEVSEIASKDNDRNHPNADRGFKLQIPESVIPGGGQVIAVFDGYQGDRVSQGLLEYTQQHLLDFLKDYSSPVRWRDILTEWFAELEKEKNRLLAGEKNSPTGSTASFVLQLSNNLYLANVGDSPILVSDSQLAPVYQSPRHAVRNQVTRSFGDDADAAPAVKHVVLKPGNTYYITAASDGVILSDNAAIGFNPPFTSINLMFIWDMLRAVGTGSLTESVGGLVRNPSIGNRDDKTAILMRVSIPRDKSKSVLEDPDDPGSSASTADMIVPELKSELRKAAAARDAAAEERDSKEPQNKRSEKRALEFNDEKISQRNRLVLGLNSLLSKEEAAFFESIYPEVYLINKEYLYTRKAKSLQDMRLLGMGFAEANQVLVPAVVDELFEMAETNPKTRLVFLEAGAHPLAVIAETMARVTGEFPLDRLHNIWATMGMDNAMKSGEMDPSVFVRYLQQENVLADTDRIIYADTDSRDLILGTETLFYRTLMNRDVMGRMGLPVWNNGEESPVIEGLFMRGEDYSGLIQDQIRKDGFDPVDYETRIKIIPFSSSLQPNAPMIAALHSWVDWAPKTQSVGAIIKEEGSRVALDVKPAYNQKYEGRQQVIYAALYDAMLRMGTLDILEARGYSVEAEQLRVMEELKQKIAPRYENREGFYPTLSEAIRNAPSTVVGNDLTQRLFVSTMKNIKGVTKEDGSEREITAARALGIGGNSAAFKVIFDGTQTEVLKLSKSDNFSDHSYAPFENKPIEAGWINRAGIVQPAAGDQTGGFFYGIFLEAVRRDVSSEQDAEGARQWNEIPIGQNFPNSVYADRTPRQLFQDLQEQSLRGEFFWIDPDKGSGYHVISRPDRKGDWGLVEDSETGHMEVKLLDIGESIFMPFDNVETADLKQKLLELHTELRKLNGPLTDVNALKRRKRLSTSVMAFEKEIERRSENRYDHIQFINPSRVPGFSVLQNSPLPEQEAIVQQLQNNMGAILEHIIQADPAAQLPNMPYVVNIGSGHHPLVAPATWQKAQILNIDEGSSFALTAAEKFDTPFRFWSLEAMSATRSLFRPGVILLHEMGTFIAMYRGEHGSADFWHAAWDYLPEGGWLVLLNSPVNRDGYVQPLYRTYPNLVNAIPEIAAAKTIAVGDMIWTTDAILIQKPVRNENRSEEKTFTPDLKEFENLKAEAMTAQNLESIVLAAAQKRRSDFDAEFDARMQKTAEALRGLAPSVFESFIHGGEGSLEAFISYLSENLNAGGVHFSADQLYGTALGIRVLATFGENQTQPPVLSATNLDYARMEADLRVMRDSIRTFALQYRQNIDLTVNNPDAADQDTVLKGLRMLEEEGALNTLNMMVRPGETFLKKLWSGFRLLVLSVTGTNVNMVLKSRGTSAGKASGIILTEDMKVSGKDLGIFAAVAKIKQIPDEKLRETAYTSLLYAVTRVVSLGGYQKFMTQPDLLREELNKDPLLSNLLSLDPQSGNFVLGLAQLTARYAASQAALRAA